MSETRKGGGWAAVVVATALLSAVVLLTTRSGLRWRSDSGLVIPAAPQQQQQQPAADCRHWAAATRLPGGCVAEFAPGPLNFACCSHPHSGNYSCAACPPALLQAVACLAPRYALLRAAPDCGRSLFPAPPPPPALPAPQPRGCPLSSADVGAGKWVPLSGMPCSGMPAAPQLVFQLPPVNASSSGSSDGGTSSTDGSTSSTDSGTSSSSSSSSSTTTTTASAGSDPAAGPACEQRRLGPAQIPRCFFEAGFDRVVVSGDSTVRMLWNRLHYLLRQAPLAFDAAASLTHGHYRLELHEGGASGEAFATDSLWFPPPGNVLPRVFNDSLLMEGLLHLAQRSAAPRPAPGGGGVSRPVQRLTYDYLVGSTSAWQQAHVRRYVAAGMGGDAGWRQRTLLVLSLCIWEGTHVLPDGWLEFVEEMRQKLGQVVLLTCPTERLGVPDRYATRRVVAQRNEVLRGMVAATRGGSNATLAAASSGDGGSGSGSGGGSTGRPLLLLDLDAMTKWLPLEVTLSPHDFHYQCHATTQSAFQSGSLEWAGGDGSPAPRYYPRRFSHLNIAANGVCDDPVAYSAWQTLFHMLCPRRAPA